MLDFIRQLAAFEGEPNGVCLTEDIIERDGFGEDRLFFALLAEAGGKVLGLVVLYQAYSSWNGAPSLVIHDLFVAEDARGIGAGHLLLGEAARQAQLRGCCRMDVNVLAWNQAARHFYERAGFRPLEGWLPYRLDREGMLRLAEEEGRPPRP